MHIPKHVKLKIFNIEGAIGTDKENARFLLMMTVIAVFIIDVAAPVRYLRTQ
jgi:hypothetical protein